MNKNSDLEIIFNKKCIDLKKLRESCYGGTTTAHRPNAWRLLLGTIPLHNIAESVRNKNERYLNRLLRIKGGHEATKDLKFNLSEIHSHQIELDLDRINKKFLFFNDVEIKYIYRNILSLFALRRPTIGYVQGMADILVPFVRVYLEEDIDTAESSAYFTFSRFVELIQTNFIERGDSSLVAFEKKLAEVDEQLVINLRNKGLSPHMYAFRWFNCFFTREFSLELCLPILDSAFSYSNPNKFAVLFSVSLVVFHKNRIVVPGFEESLLFLQNLIDFRTEENDLKVLLRFVKFIDTPVVNLRLI